jgi:hypothetical protein
MRQSFGVELSVRRMEFRGPQRDCEAAILCADNVPSALNRIRAPLEQGAPPPAKADKRIAKGPARRESAGPRFRKPLGWARSLMRGQCAGCMIA